MRGRSCIMTHAAGMTLIEVVVAAMILSIGVTAVTGALLAGSMQAAEAVRVQLGCAAAEALLEEVLGKPYVDPQGQVGLGPDAGEATRAAFDNVDDYHGFAEAAGAMQDATGTDYPTEFAEFGRSVSVQATTLQPAGFVVAVSGVTVTVTVTAESGARQMVQISRFIPAP